MLRYRQTVVNIGLISLKLLELTEDNIDEVIEQLHKAGYLAGRSNFLKHGIYFSKTGGMCEPNQTCAGELLVIEGDTWTRLKDKEFGLSDENLREAFLRRFFTKLP